MSDVHMTQYAFAGDVLVHQTRGVSDEQVRERAAGLRMAGRARACGPVERYDRCPVCQAWTTYRGKLRPGIGCPAVRAALAREVVREDA